MIRVTILIFILWLGTLRAPGQQHALVFQTDFGLKDGAVSAMKGVAFSVSAELKMFDNTHEIKPYNIWEAAYRLNQVAGYWPEGTVFVSVVDPGVGSERASVVMKSRTGHYFVTPDNGTLTFVADELGIASVRIIDERTNRLKNSDSSNTFHGRDVYAYTAARLCAGVITFEEVGTPYTKDIVRLKYQKPLMDKNAVTGNVDILDVQYGNVWTNISALLIKKLGVVYGDRVHIRIEEDQQVKFDGEVLFGKTFSDVPPGQPVAYLNSLMNFSIGINLGSFADNYQIRSGEESRISVSALKK